MTMWKPLGALSIAVLFSAARSAASLECSRQAQEQGLHGKARKKFRKKCMKDMKNKA